MNLVKTIFLVRHGTTLYNEKDLLQGRMDNPLNEKGLMEARQVSEILKEERIEIIYHSPLKRAIQTSEEINSSHKTKLKELKSFIEIDLGDWEGQEFKKIIKEKSDIYQKWLIDPDIPIPGGESFNQVFFRVKSGVNEIIKSHYKSILIVGHATVNRAILGHFLKMNPSSARLFRMRNCSISKFLVYVYGKPPQSRVIVDLWNSIAHLE